MNSCGVVVVILFALYTGCPARPTEEIGRCNDPPREQLESHLFLKGGLNGLHESFFYIPSLLGLVKQRKDVDKQFVHVRRARMDLPHSSKTGGDAEVDKSMCPPTRCSTTTTTASQTRFSRPIVHVGNAR
ncbi:uncharacterized protein LOC112562749 isoform X2 [Pomacea canaliculata]|uniref:uncharacterized protein LOC112562749 isoform X1 n=1 Tax=Pomacea canaliculata TaxID=400727 RepID=UPI000D73216B|nr:uncharacterized protein LOC112562749 isoform X1 [Pomacea canaliculata]XP_025092001.1 uncharacterized protein LOC112562749 isoform X2 [Pomacea canaliculata]